MLSYRTSSNGAQVAGVLIFARHGRGASQALCSLLVDMAEPAVVPV